MYCGVGGRLTKDHVIPRSLYERKKLPADLPTVWACERCNGNAKSLDDAWLRDLLVLDMSSHSHPIAKHIFNDSFKRASQNRTRVQSPIARQIRHGEGNIVSLFSPSGIYIGKGYGLDVPMDRLVRTLSTIVRGLYRAYGGRALPREVMFGVERICDFSGLPSILGPLAQAGGIRKLAGDGEVFQCVFAIAPEEPSFSLWLLSFYNSVLFAVTTDNA